MGNSPWFYILMTCVLTACGGGGNKTAPSDTTTVTVTGQVSSNVATSPQTIRRAAMATSVVVANATVAMFKIFPDGSSSQVDIGTITTDAQGNYTVPNVPVPDTGAGASDNFYYEVRVSSDTLDIRAPAAPSADATIDVSPESNLAARILSDVVDVPGQSTKPTPSGDVIEAVRTLVKQDASNLDDSITIPQPLTAKEDEIILTAGGIAAAGGNAEKMYKAVQFESEYLGLKSDSSTTAAQAGAYMRRVIRESCDQPASDFMPSAVADAMGQAMLDGATYTPTQIVNAYNDAVTGQAVVVADALSAFASQISTVDSNYSAAVAEASAFNANAQLGMYTRRSLRGNALSVDTKLDPDQALAFLQSIPGSGNYCSLSAANLSAIVGGLTSTPGLTRPALVHIEIFHDSGFGCNEGSGEGHFRAIVDAYGPAVNIDSVTITSSDTSSLDGDGEVSLNLEGNRYVMADNGVCVTLNQAVTYTVTANFSDSTTATTTVTRNHPRVPEASTTVTVAELASSTDVNNPTVVTRARPLYKWESPAEKLATITGAPTGSVVKYTYEFSHIDVTDTPVAPIPGCASVSGNAFYAVNSFIPTVDCDPAACASAAGKVQANIRCRMNIQTFLIDPYDGILGKAAGHFPIFCVDTDADGNCG